MAYYLLESAVETTSQTRPTKPSSPEGEPELCAEANAADAPGMRSTRDPTSTHSTDVTKQHVILTSPTFKLVELLIIWFSSDGSPLSRSFTSLSKLKNSGSVGEGGEGTTSSSASAIQVTFTVDRMLAMYTIAFPPNSSGGDRDEAN